jgi:NAD(P) transhydrogenase subunit alpha
MGKYKKALEYLNQSLSISQKINDSSKIAFTLDSIGSIYNNIGQRKKALEYLEKASAKKLSTIAMELVPRVTKAQGMDVLSSQSNLAGYRGVIEASYYFDRAFPMMMTAAGTISAAKFMILGAGVAGLQAIATAKRLGGIVCAFDVRTSAKEQVQSLGAKFIEVKSEEKTDGVYAKEMSEEYKKLQEQLLADTIKMQDVVITTALIPGKKAPILISEAMVRSMKPISRRQMPPMQFH